MKQVSHLCLSSQALEAQRNAFSSIVEKMCSVSQVDVVRHEKVCILECFLTTFGIIIHRVSSEFVFFTVGLLHLAFSDKVLFYFVKIAGIQFVKLSFTCMGEFS